MAASARATTMTPTALRVDTMRGPRAAAVATLLTLVALIVAAFVWMNQAELDMVTPGFGKVIPSRQVQVIQNLEGGIVGEILVRDGQQVEAGQILMRIDDTVSGANFREMEETYLGLLAAAARLQYEADGKNPIYPPELVRARPDLVKRENDLYRARQTELEATVSVLHQQRRQREQELQELQSRLKAAQDGYGLIKREYDMTEPLVRRGVVSQVELLRLERQVSDFQAQIATGLAGLPKVRASMQEVDQRVREKRDNFRTEALKELNDRKVRLSSLQESMIGKRDRVTRAEVRSPVKGIVKQLHANTVGGILQPGQDIATIVPLDDSLLVEAQVSPRDVAFLHPGQKALVKLTAYDFTVYGALDAELDQISADTIQDKQGNSYYLIRVKTHRNGLKDPKGEDLPIIPGMIAQVDIVTGKRTVLEYLVKPFVKARYSALRER
jgi:adhesin transport system membrane fusion protein